MHTIEGQSKPTHKCSRLLASETESFNDACSAHRNSHQNPRQDPGTRPGYVGIATTQTGIYHSTAAHKTSEIRQFRLATALTQFYGPRCATAARQLFTRWHSCQSRWGWAPFRGRALGPRSSWTADCRHFDAAKPWPRSQLGRYLFSRAGALCDCSAGWPSRLAWL